MSESQARPRVRMLSFKQLKPEKGIPYTRQYLSQLEKAGKFPKRVPIGTGRFAKVFWLESEIDEWIAGWAAARDREAA
jgi:prophage regulatory protein